MCGIPPHKCVCVVSHLTSVCVWRPTVQVCGVELAVGWAAAMLCVTDVRRSNEMTMLGDGQACRVGVGRGTRGGLLSPRVVGVGRARGVVC